MSRQTISCAIVVFNEEKNISACLNTAIWMDEIVVVDAFSTDRTMDICKAFTDRIFQRTWNGFGEQKNFAIHQSTSDWVFILDADERITSELRLEIEAVLEGKDSVKKRTGFSLSTQITELDNLSFLGILEGMQIVLNKRIKTLKTSINYKNIK